MDGYMPEHFENNPEKDFWLGKILDKATDVVHRFSENLFVSYQAMDVSDNKTGYLYVYHKVFNEQYVAFPIKVTPEYLKDDLEDELRQQCKTLLGNIQEGNN